VSAGFLALGLGLLGWLFWTHLRGRRFFDRPSVARHPRFDPLLVTVSAVAVVAGLALLWRTRRPVAATVAAALLLLWAYRRVIRSVPFQRRLLTRDYRLLRRGHPELTEHALLFRLLIRRHPAWGEELVEQMVIDYPTLDAIAALLARMERGFRGFR